MSNILLAEDEPILRELMVSALRAHGHTVSAAIDGVDCWEKVMSNPPDLLLLDLLMPRMSGYDVLQKLRETPYTKDIPCIVTSNSGQVDDLERAYTLGANQVLIKADFVPGELVAKAEALLAAGKSSTRL